MAIAVPPHSDMDFAPACMVVVPEGQAWHERLWALFVYDPGGQRLHGCKPLTEYSPDSQISRNKS